MEKKSNLSSTAIDRRNSKLSLLSAHAKTPPKIHGSSNFTGECCTIAFANSFPDLFSNKLRMLDPEKSVSFSATSAAVEEAEGHEDFHRVTDFESHAIGELLPHDEDDLLAGVTYDLDSIVPSRLIHDTEDFDLFSSGGGMELEGEMPVALGPYFNNHRTAEAWIGYLDIQHTGAASLAGEHPSGEHPSRTLFVRNINSNVEDSELQILFEQFGDIRTLYTACKHRGFVMISYYDIRAARTAMRSLQNKPLHRRKLDIHFSIPKDNPSDRDVNQGTLVVFNLDSSVSNDELRQIFDIYGEIKEIRETPHKRHHKFVEFYDVRAAEAALWALNRSDIAGKRIKLEPSRPGGARRSLMQQRNRDFEQDELFSQQQQAQSPVSPSPSGHLSDWTAGHKIGDVDPRSLHQISAPLNLYSPMHSPSNKSAPNLPHHTFTAKIGSIAAHFGQHNEIEGSTNQLQTSPYHSNSLPEYGNPVFNFWYGNSAASISSVRAHEGAEGSRLQRSANSGDADMLAFDRATGVGQISGNLSVPSDNGMPLSGLWKNPSPYLHRPRNSPPIVWSTASAASLFNHVDSAQPGHQPHAFTGMVGDRLVPAHLVASAPSRRSVGMDAQNGYFANSPSVSSLIRSGSLGGIRLDPHATHGLHIQASNGMVHLGSITANGVDIRGSSASHEFLSQQQRDRFASNAGVPVAFMSPPDQWHDRGKNRRGDANSSQADQKMQYQLDLDRILRGEDPRTTLMIKNIPNKYTVKMLLAAIDEHHRGTYNFIYLPIDFKNKCNVGYAFINMIDPLRIVPFYEAFNGKKWEKFNSEKVASLAYARIQGQAALITHFQNSSLMNEDKRCRPIIFHTRGPNMGDQEAFPMGINVRTRSIKGDSDGSTQPGSPGGSSSSSSSKDDGILGSENSDSATNTKISEYPK